MDDDLIYVDKKMIYVVELDEWMTLDEFNNYLDNVDFQNESILEEITLRSY